MKKIMLVGKSGCGKTTLTQAMLGKEISYRKTQAVDYCDSIIDTPGEYIENRRFYTALIATSAECNIIALIQDSTDLESVYPPVFAGLFGKKVIGIVTKVDLDYGDASRAERFLNTAGVREVVKVSSTENIGLDTLREYMNEE